MIRLREEVLKKLTVDWVSFHYNWREDFVYDYFSEYFYHKNQGLSSIQNSAHTLVNIFNYVFHHDVIPEDFDVLVVMNRYVYLYVNELLETDSFVLEKINELHRRYQVAKMLPLVMNRYVPMVIYPFVNSYLLEYY